MSQTNITLEELEIYINEVGSKANSLRNNQKNHEAINIFKDMIKKINSSRYSENLVMKEYLSMIYSNMGSAKGNLELIQDAIADYNMSIKFNQNYASAFNNKAGAKRALFMHGKALVDYDKAITIDSSNVDYYINRAIVKEELHMYSEALKDFEIALQLNSNCDKTYFYKGICLYHMNNYLEAKICLEKAISINKRNVEYQNTLNILLMQISKQDTKSTNIKSISLKKRKLIGEEEVIDNYRKLINEVSKRILFIKSVNFDNSEQYTQDECEIVMLNIRKILELIALSSLVANEKLLEKTRKEITAMWKAKNILNTIESKNPNFYINPLREEVNNRGTFEGINTCEELKKCFLTRTIFEKIYDKCGNLLHASTPFKEIDLGYYRNNIPIWLKMIETSLQLYSISLIDGITYLVQIDSHKEVTLFKLRENEENRYVVVT